MNIKEKAKSFARGVGRIGWKVGALAGKGIETGVNIGSSAVSTVGSVATTALTGVEKLGEATSRRIEAANAKRAARYEERQKRIQKEEAEKAQRQRIKAEAEEERKTTEMKRATAATVAETILREQEKAKWQQDIEIKRAECIACIENAPHDAHTKYDLPTMRERLDYCNRYAACESTNNKCSKLNTHLDKSKWCGVGRYRCGNEIETITALKNANMCPNDNNDTNVVSSDEHEEAESETPADADAPEGEPEPAEAPTAEEGALFGGAEELMRMYRRREYSRARKNVATRRRRKKSRDKTFKRRRGRKHIKKTRRGQRKHVKKTRRYALRYKSKKRTNKRKTRRRR